jgi:hypothetical protein
MEEVRLIGQKAICIVLCLVSPCFGVFLLLRRPLIIACPVGLSFVSFGTLLSRDLLLPLVLRFDAPLLMHPSYLI